MPQSLLHSLRPYIFPIVNFCDFRFCEQLVLLDARAFSTDRQNACVRERRQRWSSCLCHLLQQLIPYMQDHVQAVSKRLSDNKWMTSLGQRQRVKSFSLLWTQASYGGYSQSRARCRKAAMLYPGGQHAEWRHCGLKAANINIYFWIDGQWPMLYDGSLQFCCQQRWVSYDDMDTWRCLGRCKCLTRFLTYIRYSSFDSYSIRIFEYE